MEIRRIREEEGDAVGALWDRMCRELVDGGPLTERGLRNLSRLLAMSAWHRDAFCLVAVRDGVIVGFVNGQLEVGDGLLPGAAGEIESLYVLPEERQRGLSRELATAAIDWLRGHGAGTVRTLSCIDAVEDHAFWKKLGFEADMIALSLYDDCGVRNTDKTG